MIRHKRSSDDSLYNKRVSDANQQSEHVVLAEVYSETGNKLNEAKLKYGARSSEYLNLRGEVAKSIDIRSVELADDVKQKIKMSLKRIKFDKSGGDGIQSRDSICARICKL